MKHLFLFEQYATLNETKLQFQSKFLAIVNKLTKSSNAVVAEVAKLLLSNQELTSAKFRDELYSIETDVDDVVSMGKQRIKLGRLLVSFLPDVKLFKIEQFVQVYKAEVTNSASKFKLDIYKGEAILQGYSTSNYARNTAGDLHSSCMNDDLEYLELYTMNDFVSLAVCLNAESEICARTLLWEADGTTYHDRIYAITAEEKSALEGLLNERGIERINQTLEITLDHLPEKFPYVDTMCYLVIDDMLLSNEEMDGCVTLNDTGGGYSKGGVDDGMRHELMNLIEENVAKAIAYIDKNNILHVRDIVDALIERTYNPHDMYSSTLSTLETILLEQLDMYIEDYDEEYETKSFDFIRDEMISYVDSQEHLTDILSERDTTSDDLSSPALYKLAKDNDEETGLVEHVIEKLIRSKGSTHAIDYIYEAFIEYSGESEHEANTIAVLLKCENTLYDIASKIIELVGEEEVYGLYAHYTG